MQILFRVETAFALGILAGLVVANFVPADTACSTRQPGEEKDTGAPT